MNIRVVDVAGGAMVIGSILVGCSSPPSPPPLANTVPAGTAEVTVSDQKLATSRAVDCTFIDSTTTITTGDDVGGTTVVIDNADRLKAKSVDIRNLGGFTGSYWQSLGEDATVKLTGRTFTIAGTADGYVAENPSARVARPFSITASC